MKATPELQRRGNLRERVNYWSLRAVPLKLTCNGHPALTATGFFWRHQEKTFLVTNWHILSGRSPRDLQPINRNGAIPDTLTYPRFLDKDDSNKRVEVSVRLFDEHNQVNWFQHAQHGGKVDVAAIEVPKMLYDEQHVASYVNPVNVIGDNWKGGENGEMQQAWTGRYFEVGSDLFVIGFPLDLDFSGYFPIWKRASIATEFDLAVSSLPCFLIDTATRPGMSGSPVLRYGLELEGIKRDVFKINYFLGIYSGRHIGRDVEEAQLGIVWRTELISQITASGETGFQCPSL